MFSINNITSAKMKKYRLWLNLSQEAIAKTFGVATDTYARWERGEQTPESAELIALAFESLLNRRVVAEADQLRNGRIQELHDQTEFYLNEIDKMQNLRTKPRQALRLKVKNGLYLCLQTKIQNGNQSAFCQTSLK